MSFNIEYSKISDSYEDFLEEIKRVITRLFSDQEIPLAFPITGRLKSIDSIIEKHNSKRFTIKKSITELNDLVGIRAIVLFPENVSKIQEIISSKLKVLKISQNNKDIDKFGYSSLHIICRVKKKWSKIPPWSEHIDKKVEIQIRTLSEHIWAETSHVLFYKGEENIPDSIKRDFFRLSALMEITDGKLQDLKNNVVSHLSYLESAPYDEILKMDLNPGTLKRVLLHYFPVIQDLDDRQIQVFNRLIEREYERRTVDFLDHMINNYYEKQLKGLKNYSDVYDFIINSLEKEKAKAKEEKKKLE